MKRSPLPRRRSRPRSGIRDDDGPLRCPAHLAWIRGHECLINDSDCADLPIEAAHVRIGYVAGVGKKPPDDRTVPLCMWHHAKQHRIGERRFWQAYNIDPVAVATRLAAQSPALRKLRARKERE